MAASGRVLKSIPWQLIIRLQGRTTSDECRRIVDRFEEFAALLSSRWSEFTLLVTMTESADRET
ncbi:MAG: hypothetical protein AUF79_13145 [Crenarchaeota archaeon 13_1_20CM_2_51_8]|nr:MAG: hypothetical protein AUF79_13145 [Crenarchaeota archaeon 13_1_20CM_2_51_8]